MEIEVGSIYRHFKGIEIKVIALAKHSETLEEMVVYEHLSTNEVWVRPKKMFLEKVDKEKYPNVTQKYRFQKIK